MIEQRMIDQYERDSIKSFHEDLGKSESNTRGKYMNNYDYDYIKAIVLTIFKRLVADGEIYDPLRESKMKKALDECICNSFSPLEKKSLTNDTCNMEIAELLEYTVYTIDNAKEVYDK